MARHHVEGLIVFGIALGDHQWRAGRAARRCRRSRTTWSSSAVLVLANLVATAVRFVLLRGWVFHPRRTR